MADNLITGTEDKDEQASITISYIQPPELLTTYLSGAIASSNPEGLIHLMGYVERKTYPTSLVVARKPDETGSRLREIGPNSWVREIQLSALLDEDAADDLIEVLQQALQEMRERRDKFANRDEQEQEPNQ